MHPIPQDSLDVDFVEHLPEEDSNDKFAKGVHQRDYDKPQSPSRHVDYDSDKDYDQRDYDKPQSPSRHADYDSGKDYDQHVEAQPCPPTKPDAPTRRKLTRSTKLPPREYESTASLLFPCDVLA